METIEISDRRTKKRIENIEKAVAEGGKTKEEWLEYFLRQIAIDLDVSGGDLLQDLHTYGVIRHQWKEHVDFTKYDNILVELVTHPGEAMKTESYRGII